MAEGRISKYKWPKFNVEDGSISLRCYVNIELVIHPTLIQLIFHPFKCRHMWSLFLIQRLNLSGIWQGFLVKNGDPEDFHDSEIGLPAQRNGQYWVGLLYGILKEKVNFTLTDYDFASQLSTLILELEMTIFICDCSLAEKISGSILKC